MNELDQGAESTIETTDLTEPETTLSPVEQVVKALEQNKTTINDVSDHVKNVLKGMPEEDIVKFAPKVTEWDRNVQAKFRENSDKLKIYDGIDPLEAKEAIAFVELIKNNPKAAVLQLSSLYEEEVPETADDSEPTEQELYDSLPYSIKSKLDKISEIEQYFNAAKEREAAEQDKLVLNEYVAMLDAKEKEYGEFDRNIVTAMIAKDIDPDVAIQSFLEAVDKAAQTKINKQNSAPNVLGGNARVTVDSTDVSKLSERDTKDLVTKLLQAAQANN